MVFKTSISFKKLDISSLIDQDFFTFLIISLWSFISLILVGLIYRLEQLTEQNCLYPIPLINFKGLPQYKHFGFSSIPL